MTSPFDEQRLDDLERRVKRLERFVGIAAPAPAAAAPMSPPAPIQPQRVQPASVIPEPLRVPPPLPPRSSPAPSPAPALLTYPSVEKPPPVQQNPLEQVIGIKWA